VTRRRALITNDDGAASPGVIALASVARDAGFDVLVAAPHRQSSGSAASLWRDPAATPLITSTEVDGLGEVLAVAAHPGMITLLAMTGQFGPVPDLVLSGINDASNLGSGVLHSGTAGAAIIGAAYGAAAAAVSLYCDQQPDTAPRHWETASSLVRSVIGDIAAAPPGVVYNINVPNVLQLKQPLVQANWEPNGCVPTLIPFLAAFHAENGTPMTDPAIARPAGSDIALVERGFATVSAIRFSGSEPVGWAQKITPERRSAPVTAISKE
jgi:5'-nucleotidase